MRHAWVTRFALLVGLAVVLASIVFGAVRAG
jgi:hypothetical protein